MTQHPATAPKLPLPLLIHATPMSPVPNRRNILIVRGAYAPRASARLPSENLVRTLLKLCFQRGKNCGLTDRANRCAQCVSLSSPWHCADENVQKIRTQRSRVTCINRLPRQAAALLFPATFSPPMLLQMQVPTPPQPSHDIPATFAYQWLSPASVLIPRKLPATAPCCLSGCQTATVGLNALGQIDQDTCVAIHARVTALEAGSGSEN
jgi:hypothetical protein